MRELRLREELCRDFLVDSERFRAWAQGLNKVLIRRDGGTRKARILALVLSQNPPSRPSRALHRRRALPSLLPAQIFRISRFGDGRRAGQREVKRQRTTGSVQSIRKQKPRSSLMRIQ